MLNTTGVIAIVVVAYFVGSIPVGYLLGRIGGVDVRQVGSGNIGATNVGRALGKKWAVGCFIMDFLKGLLPVLFVSMSFDTPANYLPAVVAALAVIGHVWPIFLGFRGGKGVATTVGAIVLLAPYCVLMAALAWAIVFALIRVVSVASLTAAVMLVVSAIVFFVRYTVQAQQAPASVMGPTIPTIGLLAAVAILVAWRHRANIRRLRTGEEFGIEKD